MSEWLQSALERLEFWNTQAVLVPQELETVRDHLSAFLVRPKTINLVDWFCFVFAGQPAASFNGSCRHEHNTSVQL